MRAALRPTEPGRARRQPSRYRALAVVGVVALVLILPFQQPYYQRVLTLVLIWAVVGLSWNIISGYGGQVSFGHAAFFGIGAYAAVLLMVWFHLSPFLGLCVGVALAVLAAILIGWPTFRLAGAYFSLATLAYPLILAIVMTYLGYQEVSPPFVRENAGAFMQFADQRAFSLLALGLLLVALGVTLRIERSRFGLSLLAIKQNEAAAEGAGIDTFGWKMRGYVLSAALAACAGALYASVLLTVTPESVFGLLVSTQAIVVTVVGGVGTPWGPLIGAALLVPLGEYLTTTFGASYPGIQAVAYGVALIAATLLASEGIYWAIRDAVRRRRPPPSPAARVAARPPPARPAWKPDAPRSPGGGSVPVLELDTVSKAFGGLRAVDGVSFAVEAGAILGIIGPNGAGKTTLLDVLNGFVGADSGQVRLAGRAVVGLKPNQVCRLGVGRTFQVVRSFPRLSVADNVTLGAFVRTPSDAEAREHALEALEAVGLADRAGHLAAGLSTFELRLMELARALASRPRLLLIDEPLAGLTRRDVDALVALLHQARASGVTIVVIEHTMQAMLRLADRFVVLDHGRKIADGRPDDVVRDPRVIEAYLGKKWMRHAASSVGQGHL